jgi:hypothetical protein
MHRRTDYGTSADAYFEALPEPVAVPAKALRALILRAAPELTEAIKWGMPHYEKNGMVCAIRCTKAYAALQLSKDAVTLPDPDGLLEGSGKSMRHVKVRTAADIREQVLSDWIRLLVASRG